MSYPADGLPRFKVGELEWFNKRGSALDAYVYDRAYCCAIVGAFHSTSLGSDWSRTERIEATRNRAIGLAAMLEAEHREAAQATKGTEG
jgi:hypothetical protein